MVSKFLLSVHVLAAVLAVGPVAVAGSAFPRYVRAVSDDPGVAGVLGVLHRLCRVGAVLGVVVPVFGLATAVQLGVLGDVWLLVSIALTAAAAVVLVWSVLPGQRAAIEAVGAGGLPAGSRVAARLGMATGVFNLLWAVVVVLMVVRPGSTTGA